MLNYVDYKFYYTFGLNEIDSTGLENFILSFYIDYFIFYSHGCTKYLGSSDSTYQQ